MYVHGSFCFCSANGSQITQLTSYDDDGDNVTFTLISANGGPFTLTPAGLLYVDTAKGWLDFEITNVYTISVMLQEVSNKLSSPLLFAAQGNTTEVISVVDVNEYPYFQSLPTSYRLDEESLYPSVATPYSNGTFISMLNPLVSSSYNGSYIAVYDEDIGNNSGLVVTVSSVSTKGSGYFEVVNATNGGVCRGNQNCTLRVRSNAPRINYDSPDVVRSINVTLTVTDTTGLVTNTSMFVVAINDVNQGGVVVRVCL